MSKRAEVNPGDRFNMLVVIRENGRCRKEIAYECRCDCGNTTTIGSYALRTGGVKSCGCQKGASGRIAFTKHGLSRTAAHNIWYLMMSRCYRETNHAYKNYGGRGITVCDRWHKFENFYSDMGDRPKGRSLDRIDVNGEYSPGNCRWATPKEQGRNTRKNIVVEFRGKVGCLKEFAEEVGIKYATVYRRYKLMGWPSSEALTTPVKLGRCRKNAGGRSANLVRVKQ